MASNVKWYWWEVQFSDRRLDLTKTALVLDARVESLDLDEVDLDKQGKPVEITSFIESDVFCVVKTITDEPLDAIKRAISLLRPDILEAREDVQWANLGC